MRLFVDCDDTLVRWLGEDGKPLEGQNPYGGGAEKWEFNWDLIHALGFVGGAEVIVWSGGGLDYARTWCDRLGWTDVIALSKDTRLPMATDLCIDDQPLSVACRVVTAEEYVAEFEIERATP